MQWIISPVSQELQSLLRRGSGSTGSSGGHSRLWGSVQLMLVNHWIHVFTVACAPASESDLGCRVLVIGSAGKGCGKTGSELGASGLELSYTCVLLCSLTEVWVALSGSCTSQCWVFATWCSVSRNLGCLHVLGQHRFPKDL